MKDASKLQTQHFLSRAAAVAMMIGGVTPVSANTVAATDQSRLSPPMRVATIGHHLATRNVARCDRTSPLTGLLLHHLSAYDEDVRPDILKHHQIGEGFGVLGVIEKSAADTAGVMSGDEIIAVNAIPVPSIKSSEANSKASYALIEAFNTHLTASLRRGPAILTILRNHQTHSATLAPQMGCSAPVVLIPESNPDAWSDEHYAAVTQGLVDVANDDELAFAIAHEMAHVILAHATQAHGPLVKFGIGGKASRQREFAADRLGILMALEAQYHEDGATAFLTRLTHLKGSGISLTHPSLRARLAAIKEIATQQAIK